MYVVANTGDKEVMLTEGRVVTMFGQGGALAKSRMGIDGLAILILIVV